MKLLVIGAGPAGLSAAIYASRAGIETLVLGCQPKVAGNYDIDNYFGFAETISGQELIERGLAQAKRFGSDIHCERVLSVAQQANGGFLAKTESREIGVQAVIIATGVSRARPSIENLHDYEGRGVSYCVSCDGFFFRNKETIVIGEGNFAANQALELLQYTPLVAICTQGNRPTMNEDFQRRLGDAKIDVIDGRITRLLGDGFLTKARFADGSERTVWGLFVAMGEASSADFANALGLERNGEFIQVDHHQKTNVPGVFAAGDCTGGFLQIAVAVGEGAKAGNSAIKYIRELRKGSRTLDG